METLQKNFDEKKIGLLLNYHWDKKTNGKYEPLEQIAIILNNEGLTTEKGKKFTHASVSFYAVKKMGLAPRKVKCTGWKKAGHEGPQETTETKEENKDLVTIPKFEAIEVKEITAVEYKRINFQGVDLIGVKAQDDKIYVAVKPIVVNLGLEWSSQLQRIKRDELLNEGYVYINIPDKNNQKAICLDVELLSGFLFNIDSNMCKPEVRNNVKEFKTKAHKVLTDAFIQKVDNNPTYKLPSNYLEAIEELVVKEKNRLLLESKNILLEGENQELKDKVSVLEPKALFLDVLTETTELKSLRQLGYKLKRYGLGANRIFEFLRQHGVLTKVNGENYPTSDYDKYFIIETVKKTWYDKQTNLEKSKAYDVLKVKPTFYGILAQLCVKSEILSINQFQEIDFTNTPDDKDCY